MLVAVVSAGGCHGGTNTVGVKWKEVLGFG